ncbi:uncharacterized protein G6M90_00g113600 [Metarhizium brunneum]|uniref:Uncharacterized protein n=1 Tax=Metarhizium brunneum TaxID=500148 RepID=A0A7D5V619_9HYPO|nr:hypothetical protein G6M90_00g113600 [Metarhizium brunneum]
MSQPSSASDVGHLASTRRGRTRAVPEVRSMTVNAEIQKFHYLLFLELLWARILNVVLMNSISPGPPSGEEPQGEESDLSAGYAKPG